MTARELTTRETLSLLAIDARCTVSRNIADSTDTYERPGRTLTVEFDSSGEVVDVKSSDGLTFPPSEAAVVQALGA